MTRYLCVHPSHGQDGVDVSDQVRLERELLPRSTVYLAYTERVVEQVVHLQLGADPIPSVTEILTGTGAPADAPVLLVSERAGINRAAGLYTLDELRDKEPYAHRLLDRFTSPNMASPRSDDLVLVDNGHGLTGERTSPSVLTESRSISVPQGAYGIRSLASALAAAPRDATSIEEAIRQAPSYGRIRSDEWAMPWRVVVTCPRVEDPRGLPHRTTFAGGRSPEPAVVFGTAADGWDALLEDAATGDLAPARALSRAEARLGWVIAAEVLTAVALIGVTWVSGGLGLTARETPGWLALAISLAVGALAFAAIALFAPRSAEGNINDTLLIRHFYESRISTLWWAGMVSAALFALALVIAILPPVLLRQVPVPAPAITFDATAQPVKANVTLTARDLGADDTIVVTLRQYAAAAGRPSLVGRVVATGDATGATRISETVALDEGARFLSVQVAIEGRDATRCTPSISDGPGCTVVAVPPLGAGVVRPVIIGPFVSSPPVPPTSTTGPTTVTPAPSSSPSP